MSEAKHISVMPKEALEYLDVQKGKIYVDCTLGGAGHTKMILEELNGTGHLYSFDQDINVIEKQREELKEHKNFTAVHSNFSKLGDYCKENDIKVDGGILMDLGLSSIQLDDPERGFSFLYDGPLDMRMDQEQELSAETIVNKFKEKELADIIYEYGDERFSRQIASAIVNNRPIYNTEKLADIVKSVYVRKSSSKKTFKIHPATRTFMALRVYTNQELDVLSTVLEESTEISEQGATVVVITFQSQEDRIAKHSFRSNGKYEILTKKPILPSDEEVTINPRSRSAKLRAARLISE